MRLYSSYIVFSFNSHPHKEDDLFGKWKRLERYLSTHILTRRMTSVRSEPQMTMEPFNSHPHKEDDSAHLLMIIWEALSTHILTRRMTSVTFDTIFPAESFQLTSSQGG